MLPIYIPTPKQDVPDSVIEWYVKPTIFYWYTALQVESRCQQPLNKSSEPNQHDGFSLFKITMVISEKEKMARLIVTICPTPVIILCIKNKNTASSTCNDHNKQSVPVLILQNNEMSQKHYMYFRIGIIHSVTKWMLHNLELRSRT